MAVRVRVRARVRVRRHAVVLEVHVVDPNPNPNPNPDPNPYPNPNPNPNPTVVLEVHVVDKQQPRVEAAERERGGGAAGRPAALGEHQPARADEEQRVARDHGQPLVGHGRARGVPVSGLGRRSAAWEG